MLKFNSFREYYGYQENTNMKICDVWTSTSEEFLLLYIIQRTHIRCQWITVRFFFIPILSLKWKVPTTVHI